MKRRGKYPFRKCAGSSHFGVKDILRPRTIDLQQFLYTTVDKRDGIER